VRLAREVAGVANTGDVNGDNTADFIAGTYCADPDATKSAAGITYAVFGSATLPAVIEANDGTFFDGGRRGGVLGVRLPSFEV
jgi:hypothetical protein